MPETAGVARLARLRAEVGVDVAALESRAAEVRLLLEAWDRDGAIERAPLVLVAANLHGWYTALETLLERVARLLDGEVPSGPAWHTELLTQAAVEVPAVRPAVIDVGILPELHELRKFRHFFRNAYSLDLEAVLVRSEAQRLLRANESVEPSIGRFVAHLDGVLAALRQT